MNRQSLDASFSNIRCSHTHCDLEPVLFIYSRLSHRITPHCFEHGRELLNKAAYRDVDEFTFADSPLNSL